LLPDDLINSKHGFHEKEEKTQDKMKKTIQVGAAAAVEAAAELDRLIEEVAAHEPG